MEIRDWMHVNSRAVFIFWNEKAAINNAEEPYGTPGATMQRPTYTQLGMIFAQEAENIAISGFGTIDGNGRAYVYHDRKKDLPSELKLYTRQGEAYLDTLKGVQDGPVVPFEHERPYQMVLLSGITNLNVTDITIMDSPFWAVHVADSDGVIFKGVRVRNSLLMPNADGLNFTSSSNIVVSDCDIIGGDDALAFSGYSVQERMVSYYTVTRPVPFRMYVSGM